MDKWSSLIGVSSREKRRLKIWYIDKLYILLQIINNMKLKIFTTRKNKLKNDLEFILKQIYPSQIELSLLMKVIEDYQKDNLDTIEKLKRERHFETKRISGALKQTINAHGPITNQFIGSATKRIHGAVLSTIKKENIFKKLTKKIKKWLN